MIVAGYFAFVVSLTFLGTVRWVRLGPDEPRGATCAPAGVAQGSSAVSGDAEDATKPHSGRTGPRWARPTQEQP